MYCRKCGKQLNDDWKSCPYCGEPTDSGQDIEKTVSESRNISTPFYKKWLFWVLVVVIVLVIGLMSILVLKIGGIDNNEPKAQVAEEKNDFSEQDFKDLIGKKAEDVENAGLILSDTPDEYVALDGKLKIIMKNDRVDQIIIGGQSDTAPAFYSVQIGMNGEEAKSKLTEFYPVDTSTEEMLKLSNLEKKESVECNLSEGKVSDIRFLTLTDEAVAEINNEKQEKMRAEYIFPDSDKNSSPFFHIFRKKNCGEKQEIISFDVFLPRNLCYISLIDKLSKECASCRESVSSEQEKWRPPSPPDSSGKTSAHRFIPMIRPKKPRSSSAGKAAAPPIPPRKRR